MTDRYPAPGTDGDRTATAYYVALPDKAPKISHLPIFQRESAERKQKLDELPPARRTQIFKWWVASLVANPAGEEVFERCMVCGAADWVDDHGRTHKAQHDSTKHGRLSVPGVAAVQPFQRPRLVGDDEGPVVVREHTRRGPAPTASLAATAPMLGQPWSLLGDDD